MGDRFRVTDVFGRTIAIVEVVPSEWGLIAFLLKAGLFGLAIVVALALAGIVLLLLLLKSIVTVLFSHPILIIPVAILSAGAYYLHDNFGSATIPPGSLPAVEAVPYDQNSIASPASTESEPTASAPTNTPTPRLEIRHVRADTLNVRADAGTDAPVITQLKKSTRVLLLGETKLAPDGGQWVKIRAGKDEGWVNQSFLR